VDADETILDNSQFEKEFFENPATPMKIAWPAWVKRRQRPPVPGAMTFLTGVRKLGGKVAVVSNTAHALCPDVAANLESTGLPYDILLCRQESDPDRKEGRWKRVTEGTAAPGTPPLDLLVWVGDNVQDFPDQSQALRREPESSFSDFGVRFFALPNPLYGTWEKNPLE
jgi:5'-nucleotidase (lipoprotein e(P4) family)